MTADGELILQHLQTVATERERRERTPALAVRVDAIKAYQQARFRCSYADLLGDPRHRAAALFFVDELYGPGDFSERDGQFARIVPALVRLFPDEIVQTVARLATLHALSEGFDTRMAMALPASTASAEVDREAYVRAWQAVGDEAGRRAQIALVLDVGAGLDRLTRKPLLRQSLKLMRAPARAAGLAALQAFLERGFDTFAAMKGAGDFLEVVGEREEALRRALFASDALARLHAPDAAGSGPLGQLPP
jgi:hypothetical protein